MSNDKQGSVDGEPKPIKSESSNSDKVINESQMTDLNSEDMSLSNHQIDFEQTKIQDLVLIPISPTYQKLNIITGLITGLVFIFIIVILQFSATIVLPSELETLAPMAYGLVLFFCAWNVLYHYLADPLIKYAIREHDLNFQSGLIFRSLVSQPILRIQHIEIKRGPLERKFGLATLQVFSAGGASYTFNIPGLEYQKAVSLRQFILDHKDLASDV